MVKLSKTIRVGNNKYSKNNPYMWKEPQIAIDPARYSAKIAEYGIRILHEKITLCPNYKGNFESNAHDLNCPLCENSFVHFDPREMWALFDQDHLVANFHEQGFWERGSALMTFPTTYDGDANHPVYVNYFDRITLLDFEERYYELIHKSDGLVDKLRYFALSVQYLRTLNTVYQLHKDFEIDQNGNIEWISDNRPVYDTTQQLGEIFTVSYLRRPVYRVVELLHEGRYSQFHFKEAFRKTVRYPQQAVIRKDFLVDKDESPKRNIAQVVGGVVIPRET